MEKFGSIEIRVIGSKGSIPLTPDSYDVKEIAAMLQNIEDLLFPTSKKDRPIITYNIEVGSVKNIFKTSIQAIIAFGAVLGQVDKVGSIDFLEYRTAQAIENIQNLAYQRDYEFEIKTSVEEEVVLRITPETKYLRTENHWVEAELYFYGTVTNAGGKNKANIHIDTEEFGSVTINTNKTVLQEREENLLYKKYGVRAIGRQNLETGEFKSGSLKLLQLIDYNSRYNEEYLNSLISKAKNNWQGINPDEWLHQLRGDYDA